MDRINKIKYGILLVKSIIFNGDLMKLNLLGQQRNLNRNSIKNQTIQVSSVAFEMCAKLDFVSLALFE